MQWKQICENEKRSKERNRELLKDFERVERHAAMLAVKSDRLKSYKVISVLHMKLHEPNHVLHIIIGFKFYLTTSQFYSITS